MKRRNLYLSTLLVIILSVYAAPLPAQQYNRIVEKEIQLVLHNLCSEIQVEGQPNWTLKERMTFYHVNGVSIAVVKNFHIEWARGFGFADVSERRKVTTTTMFQAGSISKSLNAVGLLKLAQEGKLNLYEDINTYLRSWRFQYDSLSHGRKINAANLLSHTAGLNVHGFPGYERTDSIPTLIQLLNGKHPANTPAIHSDFEPSLKAQYSGGGTMISQMILQDISGLPYDQFMWEKILKPMAMVNSSYSQPPVKPASQLATAYDFNGQEIKGKFHVYPEQAAAGLWTTATDLAKYIIETQLALKGKSSKVLSQQMTALRLTPYANKNAALGVFIDTIGEQLYFSHNGQDRGFVGRYIGSMNGGNGVIVLSNSDDIAIVNEIINSVAIVYNWKDFYKPYMTLKKLSLTEETLTSYAGQYTMSESSEGQYNLVAGSVFNINKKGHHLMAQATGGEPIAIYPSSINEFYPKTSDTDIKFTRDEQGIVTKLTIHQNGKFIDCRRIK